MIMRMTSSPALWITVALAAGVLLMLMFWDYFWINLIHSGTIDAPDGTSIGSSYSQRPSQEH
jgi:hypothetical protein